MQPGTYVVAVSGGVDSVALLHALHQLPDLKLVVAHFDHGIRYDSVDDRRHVQQLAQSYGLPFVYQEGSLGIGTSEDTARKARYDFLHKVRETSGARAIVTAHHHDDALETAVLNLVRGTNRKGLSSLQNTSRLRRPLLHISKQDLITYAKDQGLAWRDDYTNIDTNYLRNYIRHKVLPKASSSQKAQLAEILHRLAVVNQELDEQLLHYLHIQPSARELDRALFVQLPHRVAREVVAAWFRHHGFAEFDQKMLERVVVACKTFRIGGVIQVARGYRVVVTRKRLRLEVTADHL